MKYEDLTEYQRDHYDALVNEYGNPPLGTTHFDLNDNYESSWAKIEDGVCYYWRASKDNWSFAFDLDQVEDWVSFMIEIPDSIPSVEAPKQENPKYEVIISQSNLKMCIQRVMRENPYLHNYEYFKFKEEMKSFLKGLVDRVVESGDSTWSSTAGLTFHAYFCEENVIQIDTTIEASYDDSYDQVEYDEFEDWLKEV